MTTDRFVREVLAKYDPDSVAEFDEMGSSVGFAIGCLERIIEKSFDEIRELRSEVELQASMIATSHEIQSIEWIHHNCEGGDDPDVMAFISRWEAGWKRKISR